MTGCQHPDLPLLSALGLKPIELLLLHTLRTLCAGMEHDRLVYWLKAFDTAEEHLGAIEGPVLVAGCMSLLRALLAERARSFGYMSTECAHISEEEQELMTLVRGGGCPQWSNAELATAAREVATSRSPSRLIVAARAIGGLCVRHEGLRHFSSSAPRQSSMLLN